MVAIFCMGVVFVLLAMIYGLISLTSAIIARITGRHATKNGA